MSSVPNSRGTCPVDIQEIAEAYAMKRLSTADELEFAIHTLTCRPCTAAVAEATDFVRAMKRAAGQLSAEPSTVDWQWSKASLTRTTPTRLLGASAQMRFYVTGYEPPSR